jgi:hypothetical protein
MTRKREPTNLSEYLRQKHVDHIVEQRRAISEAEWIAHLNTKLPPRDKINKFSMNQWMNESREPDGRNMRRLIQIFGLEVLPFLGLELDPLLKQMIDLLPQASDEAVEQALKILAGEEDEEETNGQLARVPVTA